jgi:hypothetical protein
MMPPTSWSHQTSISRRVEIAMTMSNVPEDEEEAEHSRRRRKRVAWMDEGHDSGNDEDHGHGGVEQFPPTSGEDHDAELEHTRRDCDEHEQTWGTRKPPRRRSTFNASTATRRTTRLGRR